MRVYHRTSETARAEIIRTQRFTSREQGEVCVSDTLNGQTGGYGDSVVTLDIPDQLLVIDDEFPSGECHYRIPASAIKPEYIITESEDSGMPTDERAQCPEMFCICSPHEGNQHVDTTGTTWRTDSNGEPYDVSGHDGE